jgi:hypothetical protein
MDCRSVFLQFRDYQKGALTPSEMTWVREHIHDCPDCYLLDLENRKQYLSRFAFLQDQTATA